MGPIFFFCYSVLNLEYFTYFHIYTRIDIYLCVYVCTHNHEQLCYYCNAVLFPRGQ